MAKQTYLFGDDDKIDVENGVTSLFSGSRVVTSVDVPEGMMATFNLLNDEAVKDAVAKVNRDIIAEARRDPWPCVVDEAYKGDPNKKLVRFAGQFYVLDVIEIEKVSSFDVDKFLGTPAGR